MEDCLFCKIANKEIKSEVVSEDENFVVFKDINPKAPIHLLIIPKIHVGPINIIEAKDKEIISGLILKAKEMAEKMSISENGYRLIFNVGRDAGMEISHLHLHLLAGKPLKFEF
ncbi:MAG: histidine triad nucleotide-binding protein [Candidatus Azambacteria bacterium]|nr:histidine triad nucleotide-binding protein [Candidatus Azambacteria bacterium]